MLSQQPCSCPVPFNENDLMCPDCDRRDQDVWNRIHSDLQTDESHEEYAKRQG